MIDQHSSLWTYLSAEKQQLARDGETLIRERIQQPNEALQDYSYLVFPYAKLYEGFLKQLFRDIGIIGDRAYMSDHFRVGKVLSPNMSGLLRDKSAYTTIVKRYGASLADELWTTWKEGRNRIFHYFPHNLRRLTYAQAETLIALLVKTMEHAVTVLKVNLATHEADRYRSVI